MSGDAEDFVFYGTPIEREEEISSRRKKAVAEASGQLRTLPAWKQEVTDEEGRRRFHGAFTGGYSAGYYNTVGSKEGWAPKSFTSSRKNRAEINQQSILNFLDEDEKAELEGRSLGTSMQFDTFGFTAAELARKQVEKEQQQRPSTIPGPIPDDLIIPATESIGVKLLLRMGWRHGRSIKNSSKSSQSDARREARKAFLAFSSENEGLKLAGQEDEDDSRSAPVMPVVNDDQLSSTPVYVINPKQDLYGLGYDPFKQAPEFREKKRLQYSGKFEMDQQRPLSMKRKAAPGFGIGALEDLDAEDEDIYDSVYDFEDTYVQEIEEPSRSLNVDTSKIVDTKKLKILDKETDVLPGFKVASESDGQPERFEPPEIPKNFLLPHKFPAALGHDDKIAKISPPEVPPPEDNNLKVLIEGMATLVARCGKLFEDLSREKNQSNPLFSFLNGGNGFDFYAWKLWEQHQKLAEKSKLGEWKIFKDAEKLTAERRGKILGEKALERRSNDSSSIVASAGSVNVQFKLSDTFTKPSSLNEDQSRKPFSDDPAKQIRFEQFLKEKYEGGLRTKDSGGSSKMSEAARARERLEFETAAEAMEKGKSGKESQATSQLISDLSATAGLQFTSGGVQGVKSDKTHRDGELITKSMYPKREEFQWRPAPVLCKRFDLIDPYMGKPSPAPRMRSKMDTLIVMPDFIKTVTVEEHVAADRAPSLVHQDSNGTRDREIMEMEVENEVEVENVERPVDLYKAIFSDDSDDEVENTMASKVGDTKKITEAASTSLNHLIAGDFLESLGKELGLEVPPDLPQLVTKAGTRPVEKKTANAVNQNEDWYFPTTEKISSDLPNAIKSSAGPNTTENKDRDGRFPGDMSKESGLEDISFRERTPNILRSQHTSRGSSGSSEDKKSRKHSRGSRRHRNSGSRSPDTDASDTSHDHRGRYRSSSKKKNKGSTREKSGNRKHSKDHKHRRNDSPGRSHRSSRKEYDDHRRKKHKYNE